MTPPVALEEMVKRGTFVGRRDHKRLGESPDLPWPAFARLQQLYRRAIDEQARREIALEFERLIREAHAEAVREAEERPAGAFTDSHFVKWAESLILDNGDPWKVERFQRAFVKDLFTGVPECWLVVPEGNGKTTLVAGLALYHCAFTSGAWVPVAASARDQAEILFRQAEGFVRRSPELRPVFRCHEGYRRIVGRTNGSRIQVLASDDRTGDGVIPTLAICDELHRHRDLRLYRTWSGKLDKRDAQLVAISTAGEPGTEFELTRERIRQEAAAVTRRGAFTRALADDVLLHEWALAEGASTEDMRRVKQANPFSGITVAALRRKRNRSTMTEAHWRRFVCNLPTRSVAAAITELEWANARGDRGIPAGERIDLGLDLGWKHDTTAMVPLWMPDLKTRILGPATVLEPPRNGSSLDPHLVEAALFEIHDRNPIDTVVMDMTDGAQLASWIESEIGALVVDRTQSLKLAVIDYARFMEALREGWLQHTGDLALTRHALNAVAQVLPRGDICFARPSESRASSMQEMRVIDALIAAAMVHTYRAAELGVVTFEPMVAFA